MRLAAALVALACSAPAQFKTTAPLVLAPTKVTGAKGEYVEGLTAQDLILYDNGVAQKVELDWAEHPISLVVAVQTSANAGAVIDKLGGSGILFTELLAADAGETAVLSFSGDVKLRQEFTADPRLITRSLRMLRKDGGGARMLDALNQALLMLEQRPPGRRRIVLMIAEKRDRASETALPAVMERVERLNATIYWLTFSPFLQPFTVKPKTAEDLKPAAERIKHQNCPLCPAPDETGVPQDLGPGGLIYGIGELLRLRQPDLSTILTKTTGGHSLSFLKKDALEHAIQLVGEEVHRQYLLTFEPKSGGPGGFHPIRVEVRNRPELRVTTRAGYWALP